MPNKPKTPTTPFRIPADVKQAAAQRAKREGETLTAVVLRALREYGGTEVTTARPTPEGP